MINERLFAVFSKADIDHAIYTEFSEDNNPKHKRSAFEESKKVSILLDAFRNISKNIISPGQKEEEFDSQNLFSKVKELMDKSKSPTSNSVRPRSSSIIKNTESDKSLTQLQQPISPLKMPGTFLPAISEFMVENETSPRKEEESRKRESSFSALRPILEENLFESKVIDEKKREVEGPTPMLEFYRNFEMRIMCLCRRKRGPRDAGLQSLQPEQVRDLYHQYGQQDIKRSSCSQALHYSVHS